MSEQEGCRENSSPKGQKGLINRDPEDLRAEGAEGTVSP